ncbi:MAG: exonuclease domain-containing protein [Weeksellaceae bacterium]|jgi:DNA polymerase-3 subunit epsilon|nr:exonuclease domain-containing protein [Weeksellaceae bacterium]MDX9705106.1 exonuclease domain-containing protein [Weeksellaceae bacterium]
MYAVLDIEATGGKKGEEDIIEIAIYQFNGTKIVDQFISLVQPERKIDPFVQKLTGITQKMVKTAPKFHEIAKRVVEITDHTILVGHNIDFDYRMLKQEFKKLGYAYYRETIDTLPLSEISFPNASSHSLGKLTKELGIPVTNRHRASGDALATLELFKLLLEKDSKKIIPKKTKPFYQNKFSVYFKDLPNSIGVFYFLNSKKEVIYLARSTNIAQSVRKLLTSKSSAGNKIRMNFESVEYEITGNEIISWIKEVNENKSLSPLFSKNRLNPRYGMFLNCENGYKTLKIHKLKDRNEKEFLQIMNLKMGQKLLSLMTEDYELCPKLNGFAPEDQACLSYEVGECHGACEGVEAPEEYNARFDKFLKKINLENRSFLLIGKGRERGESSFTLIENGNCIGYGYYNYYHQIKSLKRIKERMTEVAPHPNLNNVIQGFLFTEKYEKLIPLNPL